MKSKRQNKQSAKKALEFTRRSAEAEQLVDLARSRVQLAKTRLKEARKNYKLAKKIAKRARKEAKIVTAELKARAHRAAASKKRKPNPGRSKRAKS